MRRKPPVLVVEGYWYVTKEWIADVIKAMRNKMTRADLARAVGVSSTAITQMLGGHLKRSKLVPAVNRVVGLPPPPPEQSTSSNVVAIQREIEQRLPRIVEQVRAELGLNPPASPEATKAELLRLWPDLEIEDQHLLLAFARRAASRH